MKVAYLPSGQERIEKAFQTASTSTGASFDYLVKTAVRESNLDPTAKAKTSSAAGTFQFIESTWLETLKQSGGRFGLEQYSDQIERTAKGGFIVRDETARQEILDLRHDPEISALMAGALTQKNAKSLESFLGRPPSDGELYIAHFLGASGAKRLIGLSETQPDASASTHFRAQSRSNKPIFFEPNGTPRSARAVYQDLVNRHDGTQLIGTALASVEPKPKPVIPTSVVTLAATPVPKPAIAPEPKLAAGTNSSPVGDRISGAWNVVAAGDDPVGLSKALQVAVAQASPAANRFQHTFQIANAATKPVNLAFSSSLRQLAGRTTDGAGTGKPGAAQPVAVASLAATPANVDLQSRQSPGLARNPARETVELPARPVTTPFQVREPKTAFETLYRTDALAPRTRVGETFALAYAAQTSLFSSPESDAIDALFGQSQGAGAQLGSADVGQAIPAPARQAGTPLDLGQYLRARQQDAQRELLPPV